MRVSLDVDDTLICRAPGSPREQGRGPAFVHRWWGEPLRLGTRSLVSQLRQRGCAIWIYTSSLRTPFHIRLWLFLYGIKVDGVVNEERHRKELLRRCYPRLPSKYPPAFDIDLHVDDSLGVLMEGQEHGFRVLQVDVDDLQWTQKILNAVDQLKVKLAKNR